jgi:hypothetical protein
MDRLVEYPGVRMVVYRSDLAMVTTVETAI